MEWSNLEHFKQKLETTKLRENPKEDQKRSTFGFFFMLKHFKQLWIIFQTLFFLNFIKPSPLVGEGRERGCEDSKRINDNDNHYCNTGVTQMYARCNEWRAYIKQEKENDNH